MNNPLARFLPPLEMRLRALVPRYVAHGPECRADPPEELSETCHLVPPQASGVGTPGSRTQALGGHPLIHVAPGFALTPHGKPMNPWNKQQRQEMKHTGNRCISPESHLSSVTEWPLLRCCAVPRLIVSLTPTPPPRAHAQGREGVVIVGVLWAPARAQHELFITASSSPSGSQDGARRADTKSKNVGKFIYFSKTFLICNVLSKNVLTDPAPAIFSHSI